MFKYFLKLSYSGAGSCRRARRGLAAALIAVLLSVSATALAGPRVSVVALFNGKAMLEIDGRRQLLAMGQSSGGVRLVGASTKEAVLEIDGRRLVVGLSRSVGGSYAAPSQRQQVQISKNARGMYTTAGSINGMSMTFLVDTGASSIALNASDAARAGIDYRLRGTRVGVNTASGVTTGYQVLLDQVTVGAISLANVQAIVLDGPSPVTPLLGMSFLGRLKMRHEGALLVLEQAH